MFFFLKVQDTLNCLLVSNSIRYLSVQAKLNNLVAKTN